MATRTSETGAGTSALSVVIRLALILVFTGVETAALVVWLAFVDSAPTVSQASAIGLSVLLVGLVLEHFLTDLAVNGVDVSSPFGETLVISLSETALWALWLAVAERIGGLDGLAVAGVVLAVLLVPQHSIEDNVLRGRGFFSNLLTIGTVGFSIVEAAGATVWLLFVHQSELAETILVDLGFGDVEPALAGVAVLAIALLVEHVMGVAFSRRR